MENYAFHPEVEGFRLPTEAEWIFAAEQNWNPDSNWNFSNSGSQLHDACTIAAKEDLPCDMVWYGGEQVCNASLAKDGSKRTLFLDLAGKMGLEFSGEVYRGHEKILVVDSNGTLIQMLSSPVAYPFDHTEWIVGLNDYVIATLVNLNGYHEKIVLVNMLNGEITDLAYGDELWHPALWVQREQDGFSRLDGFEGIMNP